MNTSPSDEGAEPVHVATQAPFVMGIDDEGVPKRWEFDAGQVSVCAQIIPSTESDEPIILTEVGTALEGASGEVCSLLRENMFSGRETPFL